MIFENIKIMTAFETSYGVALKRKCLNNRSLGSYTEAIKERGTSDD